MLGIEAMMRESIMPDSKIKTKIAADFTLKAKSLSGIGDWGFLILFIKSLL